METLNGVGMSTNRKIIRPLVIQERILCGLFVESEELVDIREAKSNYIASSTVCAACRRCL